MTLKSPPTMAVRDRPLADVVAGPRCLMEEWLVCTQPTEGGHINDNVWVWPAQWKTRKFGKEYDVFTLFYVAWTVTHWRFFFLVIRVWHFLAMAFFFMCINLLAISGSAAKVFSGIWGVCVCGFFSTHSSHSHTYIRRRHWERYEIRLSILIVDLAERCVVIASYGSADSTALLPVLIYEADSSNIQTTCVEEVEAGKHMVLPGSSRYMSASQQTKLKKRTAYCLKIAIAAT